MIEYGIFHGIRGTKIDTNLLARFFVALFHCSIVYDMGCGLPNH